MACLNDFVEPGEVLIVRRPHQLKTKIASFNNIDEALNTYSDEFFYKDSLAKQLKAGYIDFEDLCYIQEELKKEFGEAFDVDTPYYETNSEYYFLDKQSLLSFLVEDNMYAARIFIAQENETYKEFIDRAFNETRGHNEPSYYLIQKEFYLEDNSFDLDKIVEIAENNNWEVCGDKNKIALIGDIIYEIPFNENRPKEFIQNLENEIKNKKLILDYELNPWFENKEEITFCYRHSSQPDNFVAKDLNELAKQYPYGAMGHIASAFYTNNKNVHFCSQSLDIIEEQISLIQKYDKTLDSNCNIKYLYEDLYSAFKESFPHNYKPINVGKEFIREINYLYSKNPSASVLSIASNAQKNILLYEDKKKFHGETKKDLLKKFFDTQNISNENEIVTFVKNEIDKTIKENIAIEKELEEIRKAREKEEALKNSHYAALEEAENLLESGTIKESEKYFLLKEKLDSTPSKKAGNYRKRKQKLLVKTFMEHLSKTSKNKLLPEVEAKYFKDLEKPNYER